MQENFGSKIPYDPLWNGPNIKKRRMTDKKCFYVFSIIFVIWSIFVIRVFQKSSLVNVQLKTNFDWTKSTLDLISNSGGKIIISTIIAAIQTGLYIVMLRYFAKFFVYLILCTTVAMFFGYTMFNVYLYSEHHQNGPEAIVTSILSFILLVVFIIMRKRINIACEIIREACKAVLCLPSTLVFPIFQWFFLIPVMSTAILTAICLFGFQNSSKNSNENNIYLALQGMNAFELFWAYNFIQGVSQMILSMTFSSWYWTRDRRFISNQALFQSIKITLRYHLGTVALGSLIIVLCQMLCATLRWIKKKTQNSCNPLLCLCHGFYNIFLDNIERALRYINRNAYIMCGNNGTDFCTSAQLAFNLLMRNILRVYAVNRVTSIIIFIGKVLITSSTLLIVHLLLVNNLEDQKVVYPTLFISCFLITSCVFNTLDIAIDTLFLSVLEDSERNDGSDERQYFMSLKLKKLIIKSETGFNPPELLV